MKKLIIATLILFFGSIANAQNYLHINITEIQQGATLEYCASEYDGVIIEKEQNCNMWLWNVQTPNGVNEFTTDEITLIALSNYYYFVTYMSYCDIGERSFWVMFNDFQVNEPLAQDYIWKRPNESRTLEPNLNGGNADDYSYQWSTGSTDYSITVIEDGTYWVRIYNDCGELYDTIQVRDNVEIELATCDLESNLNIVTWLTTPAQAEYVDHVIVKRDGIQVGTANYTDGYFLDNIGSDAASRTYTIVAVAPDGVQCPIESYQKETIHMSYLLGMGNTIDVTWNIPTGYDLMGYNICEWHEDDGSLTVIDYVGASVTSYTCSQSQFDQGYIVVQGVEAGKDGETRLLSNRSIDIVGLGENEATAFKVYPNPANGVLFVETRRATSLPVETYRIMNPIGQTVMEGQITAEKQQIDVRNQPKGVYFITVGGATKKFVVE